jgi:hypothetical protein
VQIGREHLPQVVLTKKMVEFGPVDRRLVSLADECEVEKLA